MDFIPSQHQAAGHDGCLTAGPVFAKLTTQQEIDFYAKIQQNAPDSDTLGSHLAHWMPTYMGTLLQGAVESESAVSLDSTEKLALAVKNTAENGKLYIVLQNLYHGYVKPSILDIKLGAVLVDDTVTQEKRERLAKVSASTTSGSLHFRVCGMKTYCGDAESKPAEVFPGLSETITIEKTENGNYYKYNKFFGRQLTEATAKDGIRLFFSAQGIRSDLLLTRFHQRLQLLYNCLIDAEVRIISGSLFLIYESDPAAWKDMDEDLYFERDELVGEPFDEDEEEFLSLSSLRLIDFAHARLTEGEGPDENVLVGVENLVRIFGELAEER